MSLLILAALALFAALATSALQALRQHRATLARRAAAFEDFARGQNLSAYRAA